MTSSRKSTLRQYTAYFLAWTVLGLFLFSQSMVQKRFDHDLYPWWHHLAGFMVGVYVWFLLTPVVLWLGRRFPFEREHWILRTAIHLALGVAVSILQLAMDSAILRLIGIFPDIMSSFVHTLLFLLVIGFHQAYLTYWGLLGIQYGFGWYRRYEERKQEALRLELRSSQLESQLVRAHLSALKMQIQPHFLFNTLNAIVVLVRQQKGRDAEEMLSRLSDLLRCVLDDVDAHEVPLRRELEYLQLYLSIEQVRFQDRLQVEIASDPGLLEAAVPHMILQPLVENAIRHGICRSSSAGRIRIGACRVNEMLELKIQDDGPGLAPANSGQTSGIGLANTRARLSQLYGDSASLCIENEEHGGVAATVILPCHILAPASDADFMETHAIHGIAG
jgi:two-component system, LytTR family, sensor kinase